MVEYMFKHFAETGDKGNGPGLATASFGMGMMILIVQSTSILKAKIIKLKQGAVPWRREKQSR